MTSGDITHVGTVIVGGGQAGSQAAVSLREAGYTDGITLIAEEPYLPYQRPPLSKAFLAGDTEPLSLSLRGEPAYARAGVDVVLGDPVVRVDAANRRLYRASGEALSFDNLVLAVGGRVRTLTVPVVDRNGARLDIDAHSLAGVHVVRTAADALALRAASTTARRLVAVGGSFISLEVAAALSSRGVAATVLARADRLMTRVVHPRVAEVFRRAHEARGVVLEFGAEVAALVADEGRVVGVRLTDDRLVEADLVVVGVGLIAETRLAEQMGLEVDQGIVVDALGRTSTAHVYAAGDCASRRLPSGQIERIESVHNAVQQAKAVAAAITGAPAPAPQAPWFWSDQFDLKLQTVGETGIDTELTVIGDEATEKFIVEHRRDGMLVGATAVNSPREFLQYRRELDRSLATVSS